MTAEQIKNWRHIIEYRIEKNGEEVGHHRQHLMCTSRIEELLKFQPLNEHTITPYGYDEEEESWEGETKNLEDYLRKYGNKIVKEYFFKRVKNDESKYCHDLKFEEYACNSETGIIGLRCEKCKYYY